MGHDDIAAFLDNVRLVNPKFTEFFSSLKHLLAELRRRILVNDHTPLTLDIARALTKKPNDARLEKYHDALVALCADWNRNPVAVPAPVHVVEPMIVGNHLLAHQAEPYIGRHLPALAAMYEFAVLDAVSFNCTDGAALARLAAFENEPARIAIAKRCEASSVQQSYGPDTLQRVYPLVVEARAAICTTFAIAAAYVLTEGKHQDPAIPRVEIVSCRSGEGTHVFVIVARQGQLLNRDTWGQDCRVVDVWMVAMGRSAACLENPHGWMPAEETPDIPHWRLRGLQQHYDSIAIPPAGNQPHIRFDAVSLQNNRVQRDAEQAQRREREHQDEERKEQESGTPGLGQAPCPYCKQPQHKVLMHAHQLKCASRPASQGGFQAPPH